MRFLNILAFSCGMAVSFAAEDKPNIVYLLADDLGYGDVQCLNPQRSKIPTPCIDTFTAQGMKFTDAHSSSSVCTPSRYGLLTGRYAWRTRLQSNVFNGKNDEPLIAKNRLTVPAFLKQNGYSTAIIGKWHLGFSSELPESGVDSLMLDGPTTRGFDYFLGCSNSRTISAVIENDRLTRRIEPIEMLPLIAQRSVNFLREQAAAAQAGHPFFLCISLTSPHLPLVPSAEWQGKSGLGAYGDFVMQTDAVVGAVMTELKAQGLDNNTLVLFASDNGCSPEAGVDKLEAQGHFPSAEFRGYKTDIWDGGHRIPFIARWPGHVPPGTTSSQLVCLTDLFATCAAIIGKKYPASAAEDSFNILPILLNEKSADPIRDAVVHHSIEGRFAIRQGDWKLVFCPGSGGWSEPKGSAVAGLPAVQLYDMRVDSIESVNVQAGHPEIVAQMTQLMEKLIADGRSTEGSGQPNDAPIHLHR